MQRQRDPNSNPQEELYGQWKIINQKKDLMKKQREQQLLKDCQNFRPKINESTKEQSQKLKISQNK